MPARSRTHADEQWISLTQAAKRLRMSRRTVRRYAKLGLLRMRRLDGRNAVAVHDVETAPVLTVSRVAAIAGCSLRTARRRVADGTIKGAVPTSRALGCKPTARRFSRRDAAAVAATLPAKRRSKQRSSPAARGPRIESSRQVPTKPVSLDAHPQFIRRQGKIWMLVRPLSSSELQRDDGNSRTVNGVECISALGGWWRCLSAERAQAARRHAASGAS